MSQSNRSAALSRAARAGLRRAALAWMVISWPLFLAPSAFGAPPAVELPKTGISAAELAVVVNESDPFSIRIGEYYRQKRGIPPQNLIRVRLSSKDVNLSLTAFAAIRAEVERQTRPNIQAYALAWTKPFAVECMSITSAFAFGFDPAYCSTKCGATKASPYFGSNSVAPFTDHKMRPAMLLAGQTVDDVKRLIDRGVASDFNYPRGVGYLLKTSDAHRSVRSVFFDEMVKKLGAAFRMEKLEANSIKNKKDVLFYFTGTAQVPDLTTLRFVPGAMADHLTSLGGVLVGSSQMSSLRWLEAGATGSYGTVAEPCNHLQKFPHPAVAVWRYAEGNTLIEAYWKSVAWPGEGVFIGEPLARPFAPQWAEGGGSERKLKIFAPEWKRLVLEGAVSSIGPFKPVEIIPVDSGFNQLPIRLPDPALGYRLKF